MALPEKDLLHALAAMTPARVLEALCGATGSGERAAVGVHLSSGQVVSGLLVTVDTDRGHEVAVLADPDSGSLLYVLTADVIAVEVRTPGPFTDVLTEGRLPTPVPADGGEPVTRLALQREFGPDSEFPVDVDWQAQPGSGPQLENLARVLRGLRTAAAAVRADELGRTAWNERVRTLRVEHRAGAAFSVEPTADGLSVVADLAAALPRDLPAALQQQINALL